MSKKNVIIMGAAGRDFHNFNTYSRDNDAYEVVAFTATQIPDIEGRKYPAELAGKLYPDGIPIYAEEDLARLIQELNADDCVFSYSDVSYQHVMSVGAKVNAAGANFVMLGRAYHYALAALGEQGPDHLTDMLKKDMEANMGQMGTKKLGDVASRLV